jgi:hypothetical protein
MIDRHDDTARRTGARLVSFCGHDCVPWDLIVMECASALKGKRNEKLAEVKIFDEILAGPSGGTLETVFHSLENRFSFLFFFFVYFLRVQVKTTLGFDPMIKTIIPNTKSGIKTVRPSLSRIYI